MQNGGKAYLAGTLAKLTSKLPKKPLQLKPKIKKPK